MSNEQSEKVSRNEEIRAIFIFGLLAVFAYVKVQYPTLTLTYPNGSFNLVPLINIIIIFWSLYALFMVLGLSEDTIGKSFANIFRSGSKLFLQYSFMFMGIFSFLFGLIVYGLRILLALFIVLTALIVGLYVRSNKKTNRSNKGLSLKDLKEYFKSGKVKKDLPLISGLVFLFSIIVILYYPESWFASSVIIFIAFVVAVVTVSLFIAFQKTKDDKMKDDYDI